MFTTKKIYFIIIVFLTFIAYANFANATYEVKNDGVYYYEHKLTTADLGTFQQLDVYWAKDKNHVYNKWQVVIGADASAFEVINYELGKDKNNVYWSSQYFNETYIVKEADPKTFEVLSSGKSSYGVLGSGNNHYAKDKDNIFYIGISTKDKQKINGVDKETFTIIDWKYSRDKNNIFCSRE